MNDQLLTPTLGVTHTDARTDHEKFLELSKYLEELEEKLDKTRKELEPVMFKLGYNHYVQDPLTSVVYKIIQPKGTFTPYRNVTYSRTALPGERAGSLSQKEAEGAGFILRK